MIAKMKNETTEQRAHPMAWQQDRNNRPKGASATIQIPVRFETRDEVIPVQIRLHARQMEKYFRNGKVF